ncbi:MAG: D-aminoacylase [Lachnospiraceae bacterium]|jgi:N-acyl-D-amino-acid deacylase|nr:D-aminoacylase [Lachnospiraceae bacterium]
MLDILIQNAEVIDGTGAPRRRMDVGILGTKLVLPPPGTEHFPENCPKTSDGCDRPDTAEAPFARRVIDASGLILSPGFIDVHGHTDLFAFLEPLCSAKLCQGITTELGGQCGLSPAPVRASRFLTYREYYKNQGAPVYPEAETFTSLNSLMETLEKLRTGIHMALFAAHGTIRLAAMGMEPGPPDRSQMDAMVSMAREAMEDGALGISSGLMYAPGSFAGKEELTGLCLAAAPFGGIYTSHIRNQGNGLTGSVKEALEIAVRGGLTANISHHKAVGKSNWGRVAESTALIHEAGTATHDVYPYTASSTTLAATLPPSCMKDGPEQLLLKLRDTGFRKELEHRIFSPNEEWDNDLMECGYDGILIISAAKTPETVGKTLLQCAENWGLPPFAAYCRLLSENHLAVNDICFSMSPEDVKTLIQDPLCMFGTDSLYVPGLMPMTHPRAIGTFPRILGRFVREEKLLPLEEAVRKMTGLPAKRYGLSGKGLIAEGMDADLVLFDPLSIGDRADYQNPFRKNRGIHSVYVDGTLSLSGGKPTGARAGRILRRL